jgi:GTP-binding protein EngB required for normal cell division
MMVLLLCGSVSACSSHEKPTESAIASAQEAARQIINDPFAFEPYWFRNWRTPSYSVTENKDLVNSTYFFPKYVSVLSPEYRIIWPAIVAAILLTIIIGATSAAYDLSDRHIFLLIPHGSALIVWAISSIVVFLIGGGKYYMRWDYAIFQAYYLIFFIGVGAFIFWRVAQARKPHYLTVLVCGATGVGKSTLINALAGRPEAATGIGAPVTKNTVYIPVLERQLVFYDSRGLEVAEASETYFLLLADLLYLRYQWLVDRQIDLVLICIQETQGRIDDAHMEIAALCDDLRIPYGIAITKTEGDTRLAEMVRETFSTARFVVQVRALELRLRNVTIPPENLDLLEQMLRDAASWTLSSARKRAYSAFKTQRLAVVARAFATHAGSGRTAWTSFAAAAFKLLGSASVREKDAGWQRVLGEMRDITRRVYVPNPLVRTFLTKFDDDAINEANSMRLLARIIRRFGDGSQKLSPEDISGAVSEALRDLDGRRPYRSRV